MTEQFEDGYTDEGIESLLESDPGGANAPTDSSDWAQRYMRAHRGITRACERHEEMAQNEHARIDAWLAKVNAPLLTKLERLEQLLRSFADHEAALSGGKRKKFSTPFGYTQLRAPSSSLVVDDEDAALAYVLGLSDWDVYVATKQSINKGEIKKLMLVEGEVVDGCHIEKPQRDSMTITHVWEEAEDANDTPSDADAVA